MVLNHKDILLRGLIKRNPQAPKNTTNACFRHMLVLAINFLELIFKQVGMDVVFVVVGKPEISVAACSNFITTELKQLIEGVHLSLKSALKHHLHRSIVPLRGKPVGDAVEHGALALKRKTFLIRNTLANRSDRGDSSLKLTGFSVIKLSCFLTLIMVFKNLLRKDDFKKIKLSLVLDELQQVKASFLANLLDELVAKRLAGFYLSATTASSTSATTTRTA